MLNFLGGKNKVTILSSLGFLQTKVDHRLSSSHQASCRLVTGYMVVKSKGSVLQIPLVALGQV